MVVAVAAFGEGVATLSTERGALLGVGQAEVFIQGAQDGGLAELLRKEPAPQAAQRPVVVLHGDGKREGVESACDTETVSVRVELAEDESAGEDDSAGVLDGDAAPVALAVGDGDSDAELKLELLAEAVLVVLTVGGGNSEAALVVPAVGDGNSEAVLVVELLCRGDAIGALELLSVGEEVSEMVLVALGVADDELDKVRLDDGEAPGDKLGVGLDVTLLESEGVDVAEGVGLSEAVVEGVEEDESEAVLVLLGVGDAESEAVGEGDSEGALDDELDRESEGELVFEAVGEKLVVGLLLVTGTVQDGLAPPAHAQLPSTAFLSRKVLLPVAGAVHEKAYEVALKVGTAGTTVELGNAMIGGCESATISAAASARE